NGSETPYPLNSYQFEVGETLLIVGTYIKAATITVGVDGPDDLPEVEVDIPGVVEDEPIPNGEEETFEVDPEGNYEVVCPILPGYTLTTSPNPFPVNDLNEGGNQEVVCSYVDDGS